MQTRLIILLSFVFVTLLQQPTLGQKVRKKSSIQLENTKFHIRSVASGKYIDIPGRGHKAQSQNGSNVQLWDLDDGLDRQVKFIPTNNGYYSIQFQHAKVNLDVNGCMVKKWYRPCRVYKKKKGANIQIWSAGNSEPQQWRLEQKKPGQFIIINRFSGKVLDAVSRNVHKNGCNVIQWDLHSGDNQLWELVDVETGKRYQE